MKFLLPVLLALIHLISCKQSSNSKNSVIPNKSTSPAVMAMNTSHYITENLVEPITQENITQADGSILRCHKIVVKPQPTEHSTGPWCPKTITDSKENGGIWFKDGHIYNVDGSFIAHLDDFYNDPKWKVYMEDGSIKITETKEACEAAAKPDVEEAFNNYCVECKPNYYKQITNTYYIPVTPVYKKEASKYDRRGLGLAFNGVRFDEPAPIHNIIKAHTLAPLDDCGGHVNPHIGYHYHAVTGCTKEVSQTDNHSSLLGYALDGFGIYSLKNKSGTLASNLDECGGHADSQRGYHYHVNEAGKNLIINCLHGVVANVKDRRGPKDAHK